MEDKETVKKTRKIKTEEEKPIKTKKETIKTEDIKKSLEFSLTEVIVIILDLSWKKIQLIMLIIFMNLSKSHMEKVVKNILLISLMLLQKAIRLQYFMPN